MTVESDNHKPSADSALLDPFVFAWVLSSVNGGTTPSDLNVATGQSAIEVEPIDSIEHRRHRVTALVAVSAAILLWTVSLFYPTARVTGDAMGGSHEPGMGWHWFVTGGLWCLIPWAFHITWLMTAIEGLLFAATGVTRRHPAIPSRRAGSILIAALLGTILLHVSCAMTGIFAWVEVETDAGHWWWMSSFVAMAIASLILPRCRIARLNRTLLGSDTNQPRCTVAPL